VDPLTKSFPKLTPYQYASNRPIDGIDLDGLEYYTYLIKINKDNGETEINIVEDHTRHNEEVMNAVHGTENFYQEYSKGFGPKGRGIEYIYQITENDKTTYQREFFNKDKGVGYHGIYYGPGCPKEFGPIKDHERGTNDYDYSLDPIDEVDQLAMLHDQAYDFDGYGEDGGWLPSWLTDISTIEADKILVQGAKDYLKRASEFGYKDKWTGRAPSQEAIDAANDIVTWVTRIIKYKENLKYEQDRTFMDRVEKVEQQGGGVTK